jgi:hypothetical protein
MTARSVLGLLGGAAIVAAGLAIAGCESTQDKSARMAREGRNRLKHQRGLVIARRSRDVKVVSTTTLHDANGAAVVVLMRNRGGRPLARLPIAVEVDDHAGKPVYRNDAPGLETSLVSAAQLPSRGELWWVNDQVQASGTPARAKVVVGEAPAATAPAPRIELRNIRLALDPVSGIALKGDAVNHSRVDQRRLVIYCVARKGGRVVAAGRAIIERLRFGKPAHFTLFFIGNPRGARITLAAPPTGPSGSGA